MHRKHPWVILGGVCSIVWRGFSLVCLGLCQRACHCEDWRVRVGDSIVLVLVLFVIVLRVADEDVGSRELKKGQHDNGGGRRAVFRSNHKQECRIPSDIYLHTHHDSTKWKCIATMSNTSQTSESDKIACNGNAFVVFSRNRLPPSIIT